MQAWKFTIQRQFLGAGVFTLALLTAACSGEETVGQEGDPAAKLLASAEKTAQAVASDIAEVLGTPAKEESRVTPPAPAPKTIATARRANAVQPKAASVEPARVAAVADAPPIGSSPEAAAPVEEDAIVDAIMTRPLDHTVYSAADTDVVPPTPPVASGLRPWRVKSGPAVEVIVANDGSVEKVQVLGATHMSDAMVLSHVKAWKFAPAMRGGDPVRYRLLLEDPVVP
jgi:hypothetical protein